MYPDTQQSIESPKQIPYTEITPPSNRFSVPKSNSQGSRQNNMCSRHLNIPINYFCLEKDCEMNRLLCTQCVKDQHRKHNVAVIDALIKPLSRLNMNSYHENCEEDMTFIYEKILKVQNQWQKLNKLLNSHKQKIQEGILYQMHTIMETFTSRSIEEAQSIFQNRQSDLQKQNRYVEKIKFLDKDYFEDVEIVKKCTQHFASRTQIYIRKAYAKIQQIFNSMQKHIEEIDYQNYEELKEDIQVEQKQKLSADQVYERINNLPFPKQSSFKPFLIKQAPFMQPSSTQQTQQNSNESKKRKNLYSKESGNKPSKRSMRNDKPKEDDQIYPTQNSNGNKRAGYKSQTEKFGFRAKRQVQNNQQ